MPINKSVPLSPMSTMHNNDEEGESTAYPQPSAIASDTPVNQPPWWAESDYIPPSIQKFVEANAGLSLVCLSQLFFVLMNVTVKYFISSTNISIPSLILVRQGMTALGCVVTLYYLENPNPLLGPPEIRRMLCARGFFGTGGLISTYYSFQGLSVSDTTAIQFLTPTCLLILGFLVLKERPTRRELVAGVLCLGGVMLVSRPPFLFGRLAEDDDIDVPAGRVNLPNGQIEEPHHTSRAAGVAWAFVSVLCSSTACTSPSDERACFLPLTFRSTYPIDR
jgi:drug/metabolite transporter (DMT)-like permease